MFSGSVGPTSCRMKQHVCPFMPRALGRGFLLPLRAQEEGVGLQGETAQPEALLQTRSGPRSRAAGVRGPQSRANTHLGVMEGIELGDDVTRDPQMAEKNARGQMVQIKWKTACQRQVPRGVSPALEMTTR